MHMHYNERAPMKTLEQFVREAGGRAKAAVAIGVAETTLWRWSEGKAKPRGLALRRLRELGVELEHAPRRIERVVQVRPAAEALAKDEEEMLLGMLSMSASERVADVDELRIRLGGLHTGGSRPSQLRKVVRIARRVDAKA